MAAEVRFYACEGDRFRVALSLIRKARSAGQRVGVAAPPESLTRFSQALWQLDGFQAHALPQSAPSMRQRSPVLLGADPADTAAAGRDLWLNLLDDDVPAIAPAPRIFELIGPEAASRQSGRRRVQAYREAGLQPEFVTVPA